jgi:DNA-binding NarL/FixJ family response regulator
MASVLLVEDETLIRMMIAEMVEGLGHRVVAEAGSIDHAKHLAEEVAFDVAILDVNLAGERIEPVVAIIERRGLPFIFVTGYTDPGLPTALLKRPRLQKPVPTEELRHAIIAALEGSKLWASGASAPR